MGRPSRHSVTSGKAFIRGAYTDRPTDLVSSLPPSLPLRVLVRWEGEGEREKWEGRDIEGVLSYGVTRPVTPRHATHTHKTEQLQPTAAASGVAVARNYPPPKWSKREMEYLSNALAMTMRGGRTEEGVSHSFSFRMWLQNGGYFPLMGKGERGEGRSPVRFDSEEFVLGAANWHREG